MGDYYEAPTKESLDRGYFWMTHRKMYKNILFAFLAFLVMIIVVVAIVNFYKYISSTGFEEQANNLAVKKYWTELHNINKPDELFVYDTKALNIGSGLYDLTASVENSNKDWSISELKYHFVVNNIILGSYSSFFNPGEERVLLQPGYKSSKPIASIELVIEDTKWRHFDNDIMEVNFLIEDIKFKATSREVDGNQSFTVPPSVTWKVSNNSLYDFWEVGFQVALYNGENLVGVREWKQNNFDALETKELEVIWLNDLPRVSDVKIYPIINLLDRDNLREAKADIFSYTK